MEDELNDPSDHWQHPVLQSIEQGWESLSMKQNHWSIGPLHKLCMNLTRDHRSIDPRDESHPHKGPSVGRSQR